MQYDNRLRVSQHQVASGEYSGGYMKKAEFVYYSDSKPKEMDNQVDAVFDRKFEYDFAGRLSRSEFGLYTTQNNGDVNPHMQDLTYDGFSHMNSRATEQWGANSGFAREFVNERMTAGSGETLTYDAAGNVTYSGTSSNKFQDTVFDSAGRRTGFTERWSTVSGSYSPIISERISTVEYDGDGRVVAGTIQQNRISSPTSTGAVGNSYTVHSTVLGGVLSELNYSGANLITRKTNVYAGGAIIAEQRLLTGQDDKVVYLHADPVTGSRAEVGQSGELVSDQQFEPLGQRIRTNPPIEEQAPSVPPPAIGDSLFPEWQCMIPRDEGNGAFIPRHCSQAAEQQDIFWYEVRWEKKGNPARIHAAAQRNEGPSYQDELNTQVAATDKPDDGAEGAEDCPKDKNGFVIQPCEVRASDEPYEEVIGNLDVSFIPNFVDASSADHGGARQTGTPTPLTQEENNKLDKRIGKIVKRLETKKCKEFLEGKNRKGQGVSIADLKAQLTNQSLRFSGPNSTNITAAQAGLTSNQLTGSWTVSEWFKRNGGLNGIIQAAVGSGGSVYYRNFNSVTTILHENLHVSEGLGDIALANRLGLIHSGNVESASQAISAALILNGCT